MRNLILVVALTGCADNSEPPLDVMPCTAFAGSQTDTGATCQIDLRDINWSSFKTGAFRPTQLRPDGLMISLYNISAIDGVYSCESAMWTGDDQPGAAIYVGQDNSVRTAEGLTCAWVPCVERMP